MAYDLKEAAKHVIHDYAWLVAAGTDTQRQMPGRTNHYAETHFSCPLPGIRVLLFKQH
jgi:hypothetical protein